MKLCPGVEYFPKTLHVLISRKMNLFCFSQHNEASEENRPLLEATEVIVPHVQVETGSCTWKTALEGNKIDLGSVVSDEEFDEFVQTMDSHKEDVHIINLRLDCLNNTVVVPILNERLWVKTVGIKNLGKIWESEQFRTYVLCQGYKFLTKVESFLFEVDSDLSNSTLVLLREIIEICPNLKTLTLIPLKTSTSMDFHTCERYMQDLGE